MYLQMLAASVSKDLFCIADLFWNEWESHYS